MEITGTTVPIVVSHEIELARVTSPTLAVDAASVYYASPDTGELRAVPKTGGESRVLGAPAPAEIALTSAWVYWISSSRDRVLRVDASAPATPETVLEGGPFFGLATSGSDVWLTSFDGDNGALLHLVPGAGAVRVAATEGKVETIFVDTDAVYMQTRAGLFRAPRAGPSATRIWSGADVSGLSVDDAFVYSSAQIGPSRALIRTNKQGGSLTVLQHGVRGAPFALFASDVFYFDADLPMLRRVAKRGGASTIVARSLALGEPTALVVDFSGIFVASSVAGGRVLALPVPVRD